MLWLVFALASGFSVAVRNVVTRKMTFVTDNRIILYSKYIPVALLATIPVVIAPVPEIEADFWWAVCGAAVVDIMAFLCLFRAISSGELGKTFPLIAFTPIFLIGTAYLINAELPSALGTAGILAIVAGAYILRVDKIREGPAAPFKSLFYERAPRYALMAAFLFSFAAAFYKKATVSSSPYFTLFVTQYLAAFIVLVFQFARGWGREIHAKVWRNRRLVFFLGLATFFEGLCLMIAFGMAGGLTSYAIGVKRTSILFTIVMGFIFFGEGGKVRSLAAGVMMLVGIFLIAAA